MLIVTIDLVFVITLVLIVVCYACCLSFFSSFYLSVLNPLSFFLLLCRRDIALVTGTALKTNKSSFSFFVRSFSELTKCVSMWMTKYTDRAGGQAISRKQEDDGARNPQQGEPAGGAERTADEGAVRHQEAIRPATGQKHPLS